MYICIRAFTYINKKVTSVETPHNKSSLTKCVKFELASASNFVHIHSFITIPKKHI